MRRILFGGVFALVIGTLLAGEARAQQQNYNMQCLRIQPPMGMWDLLPNTVPGNYFALDGCTVGVPASSVSATTGSSFVMGGSPGGWNSIFQVGGSTATAVDGDFITSCTTQTGALCAAGYNQTVLVPEAQATLNLSASVTPAGTGSWTYQDGATSYSQYQMVDPSFVGSTGTLLATLYLSVSGSPADPLSMTGMVLITKAGESELAAASSGPGGWWVQGRYLQDTAGNRSGSVPPVFRPPVEISSWVPPTFGIMVFPTEIVTEGQTVILDSASFLDNSGLSQSGTEDTNTTFLAKAWFEVEIDPN